MIIEYNSISESKTRRSQQTQANQQQRQRNVLLISQNDQLLNQPPMNSANVGIETQLIEGLLNGQSSLLNHFRHPPEQELIERRFKEVMRSSSIYKYYAKIGFQGFFYFLNIFELGFTLAYDTRMMKHSCFAIISLLLYVFYFKIQECCQTKYFY
ncbi:unnamed protein product [Paramecium sonneborni]|uniref:Transmembrane protein n=1 Tax=Paramecium sonneborni TaxID=65129 RepID=A0A8S1QFT7_9CILI|nr:unnamed protein product [Paramecium sonneborni]